MELTIDQALQKGIEAHQAGQVQESDRFYTAILKAQPKHPDANHNMGVLAVGLGKVQEALPFFKTALEVNPSIAQYWLSYIDALIQLGHLEGARTVLEQARDSEVNGEAFDQLAERLQQAALAENEEPSQEQVQELINLYNEGQLVAALNQAEKLIKQYPKAFLVWNILGAVNKGLGRLADASEAFRKVTLLNPNYVDGLSNLGIALQGQGKLEEAVEALRKALSIKPEHSEAYNNMGVVLQDKGEKDAAIESYKQAIKIKPDYADAYYNMGNALRDKGELDAALDNYKQAIKIKPDYADAFNNMGSVLGDNGEKDAAIDNYKQAIKIKPDHAEAYYNMGNALQDKGELDAAIESYKQAIKIKPDYAQAYYNMGNALQDKGELDAAIESYKQAIKIKPDYAAAYNNMGSALKNKGEKDAAIESYKQAIKIKPDYAEAYNNMGAVLGDNGEKDAAIDNYKQAIKIKPDHADTYYNMGAALQDKGEFDAAIESYKQALKIKPEFAKVKHLLASLIGKTTKAAPREYVEDLFDQYAAKFEHSLVEKLEYRIPKIITDMIIKKHPSKALGSVLDLGCGTGLAGLELKQFCENLDGIDLSKSMLEQARAKGVYDKLIHGDIIKHLTEADLDFDYFISTDVFIYVGELSDVFKLVKYKNKRRGKLVFSTEHTEKQGFHLETSGRYSHSKNYIEGLCDKYGYHLSHFERTKLRKEKSEFLTGGLYLLDFDPAE